MKYVFNILLSLIFLFQPLQPVVILVHGSFAQGVTWWRPGGDFFNQIALQSAQLGHEIVPFGWSGNPTEADIALSGELLAWLILSYPITERIVLIGHSHGGNVVTYATQVVHKEITKRLQNDAPDNQTFMDLVATVRSDAKAMMPCTPLKPYLIDKVYLLGAPAGVKGCFPQMDVIGSVLNFYSTNDRVQQVLGLYGRTLATHDRIANLEVTLSFTRSGKKVNQKPGHSDLHNDCIGRWLLQIPEVMATEHQGNFENFAFGNGSIDFDCHGCPSYNVKTTPGA
jgi:hypothetical protein